MKIAALLLTLVLGQFTDRTTGQPLHGVHVELVRGTTTRRAVSGEDGRFTLRGIRPGSYTLHYFSEDVPPKSLTVTVRGAR